MIGAPLGEDTRWSVREQALYWVDILGRRPHCFRPSEGSHASWDFDEEISAVAERVGRTGLLLTLRLGLAHCDPVQPSDSASYHHRSPEEPAGNRFNDGACDARSRFRDATMDFECVTPTGAHYGYTATGECRRYALGIVVGSTGPSVEAPMAVFVRDGGKPSAD